MPNITITDITGKSVKDEDLQEAIKAVEVQILTGWSKLPPLFFIHLTTIHQALKELKVYKNIIKKEALKKARR